MVLGDVKDAAERALNAVTVAVANAGVFPNCPVLDMLVAEWDRVTDTNLRGTFPTCRAAGWSTTSGGCPGKIITISSGAHASARLGGRYAFRDSTPPEATLQV